MDKDKSMFSLAIITAFVVMAVILPGLIHAGDLEPPGPPGSTMHTLDEIYNKVDEVVSADCGYAPVAKTGREQTCSYCTGDDADLRKGVAWPNPRFTDNSNGTVTDNLTGLIWLKNINPWGPLNWPEAVSACNNLADDGSELKDGSVAGDWRLPNIKELQSMDSYLYYCPGAPTGDYPFTASYPLPSRRWSSTTYVNDPSLAWYKEAGSVNFELKTFYEYTVWPVRGGND